MKRVIMWGAVLLTALPGAAVAQDIIRSEASIDKRQAEQLRRIDEATRSGKISHEEAARLRKAQDRIKVEEMRATDDGKVTPQERARIQAMQDEQDKLIGGRPTGSAGSSAANARKPGGGDDRIDNRQAAQDKRLEKGVKSGQLTREEAARLEKGQKEVRRAERRAEADGRVTNKERAQIEKMQDQQSKAIRRETQDDDRRKKQ